MVRHRKPLAGKIYAAVVTATVVALLAVKFTALAAAAPQGPWVLPASDLSAPGQISDRPQVSSSSDGTVTAVWDSLKGSEFLVESSTQPPGGSFGTSSNLSVPGQPAVQPRLVTASDGTVTTVWSRFNGTNYVVQAATRPPGGSFGEPLDLSQPGHDSIDPALTVSPDGTVTAIWQRTDSPNSIIQAATRPPGGSFGEPLDLSLPGQYVRLPQIAASPDGTVTAIWQREEGANTIVQAATRTPGGSFGDPVVLSGEEDGQYAVEPQLAASPDGTVSAVWQFTDDGNTTVQVTTRLPGGDFGEPVDISAPGQAGLGPQIAVSPDGTATAVWSGYTGFAYIVQSATRPPGGSFGEPVELSEGSPIQGMQQLSASPDGTVTAIWNHATFTRSVVQASSRPPGGPFGEPVDLSDPNGIALRPHLTSSPNGRVTAVWKFSAGDDFIVQSASTAQPRARIGRVTIKGPRTARVGRAVTYRVTIRNTGDVPAKGVRVQVSGKGIRANSPVGVIGIRKSRTIRVKVRPRKPGKIRSRFRVISKNAGKKSASKRITVRKRVRRP